MSGNAWIFVDLPIGGPTGAAYMAESWARELRELGWRVRVFSPSNGYREHWDTDEHVAFRTLKGIGFTDDHHPLFSILRQLWKYRRRRDRPDVILLTTPMRMGSLGLAIANVFRIPLVIAVSTDTTAWSQHHSSTRLIAVSWPKFLLFGIIRPDLAVKLLWPDFSWFRRYGSWSAGVAAKYSWVFQYSAKELILLGERNAEDYAFPHPEQRVSVFSAGIDRLPEPAGPSPIRWRDGALRVLFVGRLVKEKGIATLLNAVAICRARGLDVQMAAVGEGEQAAKLPRMAEMLGIQDDLIVAGPFPRRELGAVYRSGDVFGFPSTFDTQGFVLNEAAHEGLPMLVADDVNRVCVHEESALVLPQTPEAFADAIERLADPAERARLGAGAQRLARSFTEAGQAGRVAEIFDRVTGAEALSSARISL